MATNKKSPQFIKISDEYLIEAGILPEKPRVSEAKAGPPVKENKFTLIKVDEEYLEELRKEAEEAKGFRRPSMSSNISSKRQSGTNNLYNLKKTTTTISRRTSNVKKEITRKSISNIGKVLKTADGSEESLRFFPIPPDLVESLGKGVGQTNVRKQLFKMPMPKATLSKKIASRTVKSGKYFQSPGSMCRPKINLNSSPLLEIDEAESVLKKKSTLLPLEKPKLTFSVPTPSRLSTVEEETSLSPSTSGNTSKNMLDKQRSSTSSNSEFEAMEQMCNDRETEKVNDEINKILGIIKTDREEFEKYKEAYNRRMSEIAGLLNGIMNLSKSGKISQNNSTKRRSKPKTPNRNTSKIGVTSNKSFDLRKNVLTASLGNTPKEKKAERMYNSLREVYGILETPKFDKKTSKTDCTTPKSGTKNISTRLQEQCLMLLDTPRSTK